MIRSYPEGAYYIDANSIRVRGKFTDAWEKHVVNSTDPRRVAFSLIRLRFDCKRRRYTTLYIESFLKNGDMVDSGGFPESRRTWEDIGFPPGSPVEAEMKLVCSHRARP